MVEAEVYKVSDIVPYNIRIMNYDFEPLKDEEYEYITLEGTNIKGKINEKGFVLDKKIRSGGRIKLKPEEDIEEDIEEEIEENTEEDIGDIGDISGEEYLKYPENPGPLPSLNLKNTSEGGEGPIQRDDNRKSLVDHLQRILNYIGYDIGSSGPEEDGIDGLFKDKTETAVKEFQKEHKDWKGEQLKVDGLVGPLTSDTLNRELVGIWYSKYETPTQITSGRKIIATIEDMMIDDGLTI